MIFNMLENKTLEEIARSLKNIEKKLEIITNEGILVRDVYTTKVRKVTSQAVNTTSYEFLKIKDGMGIIRELFIDSNSTSFSLYMMVDDQIVHDETFTFFDDDDANLDNVFTSTTSDNQLVIRDIYFKKNVFIKLTTTASVTFSTIYARMDLRGEELITG